MLWYQPSLMKLGKSSGALFSFCIRLLSSNKRLSSYGFLLFVFPVEDEVGKKTEETERNSRNLRFILSSCRKTFASCDLLSTEAIRTSYHSDYNTNYRMTMNGNTNRSYPSSFCLYNNLCLSRFSCDEVKTAHVKKVLSVHTIGTIQQKQWFKYLLTIK